MSRIACAALAILAIVPSLSPAQNKNDVRNTAKQNAAQLRTFGEPMDRCSLSASLGAGPVVLRTHGLSALEPGDILLTIDGSSVTGKSVEDVVMILRKTAPTKTLQISVERNSQPTDMTIVCTNSRPTIETLLSALDLASRGKFDECASAVAKMPFIDTSAAALRADCASLSRNASKTEVSTLVANVIEMAIDDALYVPSARPAIVSQLRNLEGPISEEQGAARYRQLVDATKRWPGGEGLYASSAPDWALFRRNAEAALRSRLIDPESARIEWPHGFLLGTWKPFLSKAIEGYWSCGLINARNRMGGYTGSTAFVVVVDPTGYVKYSELGGARDLDVLSASCANSVRLLPPPPPELMTVSSPSGTSVSGSLADELKKLVDLKNSGALTDAEFQAAKAKLLNGSGN